MWLHYVKTKLLYRLRQISQQEGEIQNHLFPWCHCIHLFCTFKELPSLSLRLWFWRRAKPLVCCPTWTPYIHIKIMSCSYPSEVFQMNETDIHMMTNMCILIPLPWGDLPYYFEYKSPLNLKLIHFWVFVLDRKKIRILRHTSSFQQE
jgi:hypothetical protein